MRTHRDISSPWRVGVGVMTVLLLLGLTACGNDDSVASITTVVVVAETTEATTAIETTVPVDSGVVTHTTAPSAETTIANADETNYSVGPLHLGLGAAEVVTALGEPETKDAPVEEEATGLTISEWAWPAQGVRISMDVTDPNAVTVSRFWIEAPSTLQTGEGIGIGSAEAGVRAAYDTAINAEESGAESIVVGSIFGGMIFDLGDGKVTKIFVGAAAE